MDDVPLVRLSDGKRIPQVGLGLWQVPNEVAVEVVRSALKLGYRLIDTAASYENESGVGAALTSMGYVYVTTKVPNTQHGYDAAMSACEISRTKLRMESIDLYLIHWPIPQQGLYVDTWNALVRLRQEGLVRSIGVSNFTIDHLKDIMSATGVAPSVNQIELHPRFQQRELCAFHAEHGIATEAWSPLGRGLLFNERALTRIARKHGKSIAQVILRWHVQNGYIAIPKTTSPARMKENLAVFDFYLDWSDMSRIAALDRADGRLGPDPLSFGS